MGGKRGQRGDQHHHQIGRGYPRDVVERGGRNGEAWIRHGTLRAAIRGGGTGLQVPLRLEIDGSKDFKSERVLAYELGYRTEPMEHVALDAALFYNSYDRLRVLQAGEPFGEPVGAAPSNLVQPFQLANLMHGHT